MPRLSHFVPALHHALIKARANPPEELSASVERQAREYLMGLKDGKVQTTFLISTGFGLVKFSTRQFFLLLSLCTVPYFV